MPVSEAALDTPRDQVATRYLTIDDHLGGVEFVRGIARAPMSRRVAERLQGALGPDFQIVGPWTEPSSPPLAPVAVPHPPIVSSQPPAPASSASGPEDSPLRAATRRLRRTP